ncbi:MAG: ice-binding family protein, partial [Bacteroidetes bacterium]|nr:ice-binding family protein [Bacteroidota bacterium]
MKNKLLIIITAISLLFSPKINFGQIPNLGTASSFTLFTSAGAFTNLGLSQVTGDIGTNVGAFTGFPPGVVLGQIHVADATTALAASDLALAYGYLSGITCGAVLGTTLGNNQVLTPNVYCLGAAATLNGNLTLDGQGNPNAIFIFKINGALSTSTFSNILLINSAYLGNVYWQINGEFVLGDNSVFMGTIIANGAITLLESSSLMGRGLSIAGAISLHNNFVNIGMPPVASVISANGPTTFCTGGNVILSGNIGGIWSTGATTASITVNTSGDYFVTNTNPYGTVISNHIIVTVNTYPIASTISASGPTTFCAGGSVILSGNSGGTWSNGSITPSITANTSGDYFVTNTTICGSITSNHILVSVNPLPIASVILANGPTSFCIGGNVILSGNTGGIWSTGSLTPSITVNTAGDYFVTNTNSCGNITSNHILVTVN